MTFRTFALVILSVLAAPAPAAAEPTYRGRTAQQWVAALRSRSYRERKLARMTVDWHLLDDRSAADLVDALGDPSWEVRKLAEEILDSKEARTGPQTIAALLRQLAGPTETRLAAARTLGRWLRLWQSEDQEPREAMPPRLIRTLADWSASPDPARRAGAATAWAHLAPAFVDTDEGRLRNVFAGPFIRSLTDPDAHVRLAAVQGIASVPYFDESVLPREWAPASVEAMFDPNPEVRRVAGGLVGLIPDDAVVPLLSPRLASKDLDTRRLAARLMLAAGQGGGGVYGPTPRLPHVSFVELASDPDPEVRAGAARVMPPSADAVALLRRLSADDPVAEVRADAAAKLMSIAHGDVDVERELSAALRRDPSPDVRLRIAERIVEPDAEVLALVARMARQDGIGQWNAVSLLDNWGAAGLAALVEILQTGSDESRRSTWHHIHWKCRKSPDPAAEDFAARLVAVVESRFASPDGEVRRFWAEQLMEGRRDGVFRLNSAQIRNTERVLRETSTISVDHMLAVVARPSGARRIFQGGNRAGYNEVDDRLLHVALRGGYKARRQDADTLLAAMRNEKASPYARLCAARFLLPLDSPDARRYVDACLDGSDARLRANAVSVLLEHIDADWAIPRLIKLLGDGRLVAGMDEPGPRPLPETRPGFWPTLPEFPDGDEYDHRVPMLDGVCSRLAELECREAAAALMALVRRDPDRAAAVEALRLIAGERAMPLLVETLRYPEGEIREPQLQALVYLNWAPAVIATLERPAFRFFDTPDLPPDAPALLRLLQVTADAHEREILHKALMASHDPRAVPPLLEFAETDGYTMLYVAWSLEAAGGDAAIRGLVKLLDRDTREWAKLDSDISHRTKYRRVGFERRFEHPPWPWRSNRWFLPEAIGDALEHLTGQEFGTDPDSWKAWLARR